MKHSLNPLMSKADAEAFKLRWQLVNEIVDEEMRQLSLEQRWQQVIGLFNSARVLGWDEKLREQEEMVRARWLRLKEGFND